MMRRTSFSSPTRSLLVFLLMAAAMLGPSQYLYGQQPGPAAAAEGESEDAKDPTRLPAPLQDVKSNVMDFEKTGYLKFIEARFRPGGGIYGDDDAVVWTFRTTRHVTCRHLERLLEDFYDVRIYDSAYERLAEVHRGVLVHPARIRTGAVNGVILKPGEYVDLWIHFRETDIRRMVSLKADQLVFRPLPPLYQRTTRKFER